MRLSTQPRTGLIAVTDLGEQVADLGAGAATTTGSVGDTAGRMRLSVVVLNVERCNTSPPVLLVL